jgi:hypothetical protein
MSNKQVQLKKDDYTIDIKYSDEAVEKKLIKFTTKSGDEIVFSADEMISMLVSQVNTETLEPTFVDMERINVVEVGRQLKCVLDRDFKKGEEINLNYTHPYPLEFALIEEMHKIAKVDPGIKVFELTGEFIKETKEKIKPEMEKYVKKFYDSFKQLKVN